MGMNTKKIKSRSSNLAPNLLLGQRFLVKKEVVNEILEAAGVSHDDIVLEVGPGRGILTEALAERAKKIIAVEKDARLSNYLERLFAGRKNVTIIEGDILKSDPKEYGLLAGKYKIVANLPYYLSSRFLRLFLEKSPQPHSMTLMLQYEVAKRLAAVPSQMNLLALSVQAYGRVRLIRKIPASYFKPRPKVDSAIVSITDISKSFFEKHKLKEEQFFKILKRAFSQKRKILKNSLSIADSRRPQELSLDDWAGLVDSL